MENDTKRLEQTMAPQSTGDVPRCTDADASHRCLGRESLTTALQATRQRTLALVADYARALGPTLAVPLSEELNPPLWELGHVGWFADWWIARNPQRHLGVDADPRVGRAPARQARRGVDADALYNSSEVAHARRWTLALPDRPATEADLAASLADTLHHLADADDTDGGLYFFRLALYHEDMHAEAAVHMAQTLGIALGAAALGAPESDTRATEAEIAVPAGPVRLGWDGPGFAFDNELGPHTVPVAACRIDASPVSWDRFLPFVEAGGYHDARWWTEAGWAWRSRTGAQQPRHLQRDGSGWSRQVFGQNRPLCGRQPAVHLNLHEALAWCRWAGRRLPTEAEWTAAARQPGWHGMTVWEWTSSRFAPFPDFHPHPYRDYSQPWFDGRPVLKGASTATAGRLRHAAYRNYYTAERNDILAGFRSVAL